MILSEFHGNSGISSKITFYVELTSQNLSETLMPVDVSASGREKLVLERKITSWSEISWKLQKISGIPLKWSVTCWSKSKVAFLENDGGQCGFCTPGFIMSAIPLMEMDTPITRDQISEALGGNLCRCNAYGAILDSVNAALDERFHA